MGETKIEWTATRHADGTVTPGFSFNPWIGCTRVSAGCVNCYAEAFAKRYGKAEWGPTAERVRTSPSNWRKPFLWNRKAKQEGRRYKVFCSSLADVFEDNPQIEQWRYELFNMILDTKHLDWLLLTKRPEDIKPALQAMSVLKRDNVWDHLWLRGHFPHVWIGTSVETQEMAERRIPELLKVPASVRFLSCEPLLGSLDLTPWLTVCPSCGAPDSDSPYIGCGYCDAYPDARGISWIIVGGESGPKARPMHPDWSRSLRDQCRATGVPFFFKQWGQFVPVGQTAEPWYNEGEIMFAADKLTVGRFIRLASKNDAGRQLDGREWNEMPRGEIVA